MEGANQRLHFTSLTAPKVRRDVGHGRMKRMVPMLLVLACAGCGTTGYVRNWGQVTIAMPREQVHRLLGEPTSVLSREQWDSTVRKPGNSMTMEGILVLSSSMLCQFEAVEMWPAPKNQHDYLRVYFSKTGKVLGRQPYRIEEKYQPTSTGDVAIRAAPER